MDVAKKAVLYYAGVTGKPWSSFYDGLDEAVSGDLSNQTGDIWLIHALMTAIEASGVSLNEVKMNKDMVKALFDVDSRKKFGEFYTSVVWAEELHKYMDKYIPGWRKDYNVWEMSCYTEDTGIYIRRACDTLKELQELEKQAKSALGDSFCKKQSNGHSWIFMDNFIFEGLIPVSLLRPMDEVLTMNPVTRELSWSGYHDFFLRDYTGELYTFEFELPFSSAVGRLNVTPNHRMLVRVGDSDQYEFRLAKDLLGIADNDYFVCLNFGAEARIVRRSVKETTTRVWDLTTYSENHCFVVDAMNGYTVVSGNCGSGNLIRTAGIEPSHLFASTIQADDITLIRNTPELEGCEAFQLDFLSEVDDGINNLFFDKLPPRLQKIIKNDEPLIFLANPPYKSGMAKATPVGNYMSQTGSLVDYNFTDFSKPAYDIFYQFCFQIMNIVAKFNLSHVYYCFFSPLTFFTGSSANILLRQFEHCFEFVDGMCISAQEFSDTSESILWGIAGSVWKGRGGYQDEDGVSYHKDVLLDKKYLLPGGGVGCEGKVLYEPPREKLSSWVAPRDGDGVGLAEYPLMTSHLTFKGGEVFEKVAYRRARLRKDAMGILMTGNTLTRSSDQSAVLSMPSTLQHVPIVQENFWRCVASYAFRRLYDASWAITKKEISAPNTGVSGYDLWLRNVLVLFLFEYKSMQNSLRGVVYDDERDVPDGNREHVTIRNQMFYCSADEVREHCHDEVILRDLDENPPVNQFMLDRIEECKDFWLPEVKALYDWCKGYTLESYDKRVGNNYRGSLECWDAGFQQIRTGLGMSDEESDVLTSLLSKARDCLRQNLDSFGFVTEVDGKEEL